ncbi:carboxymuconolactone decarboxylase family protein [Plantactinospora sp. KBS50]|uniref:carboxymuconolactone decarboxylase family protein n=1 Tax=Plantactinospora sp. KBS50 TaxID=2024580 RepID=UPI000BAB081A|nr:carboxymuconolactone decarboxylase family protein [Plantactinospora sp. KBS50]ASW57355.1 alkylhydroperoxidase [Plantactinospora sp. KBS50]
MPDVFPTHTIDTAPLQSRPLLERVRRGFGYLPAAVGLMAESPHLLDGFLTANRTFEASALDPVQREVVVLTVATRNDCHLCLALHTAALHRLGAPAELIAALRAGTPPPDPRLAALHRFTLAVLDHRGRVPDADLADFFGAGYAARHALDVVLGIGTYTMSTFANRLLGAPIDEPLRPYA